MVSHVKLNIWYLSAYDAPEGQSSRTYDYAIELVNLGHQVTIITSSYDHFTYSERLSDGEKWREEYFGKVRVIWIKTFPYKGNGWQRGLNMLTNAWRGYWIGRKLPDKPDVILGPSVPLFTGLSAYFLSRQKKANFYFEVRDIWPQALIDLKVLSPYSPLAWTFRRIEKFLYKKATKIISALPLAYKHICKEGLPFDKVLWFPNGVNLERFIKCAPYTGGSANKLVVMYVGRAAAGHGVEVIIQAAKMIQSRGLKNIDFIFVGGGSDEKRFKNMAKELQLTNFEFKESVPKKMVPHVMNVADVLIASLQDIPVYRFGINLNKIYDYLASGRPIIFAINAPNNDIENAKAGISIPPGDPNAMVAAIEKLLVMSSNERSKLGENARNYAEVHYDIKILAKRLENVLLSAV